MKNHKLTAGYFGCEEPRNIKERIQDMSEQKPITIEDLKAAMQTLREPSYKPPKFDGFMLQVFDTINAEQKFHYEQMLKAYEDLHHNLVIQVLKQYSEGQRAFAIPQPIPSPLVTWDGEQTRPTKVYYVDNLAELRSAIAHGMTAFDCSVGVILSSKFSS